MKQEELEPIDFIKIDTQGTELGIFIGGIGALKDVLEIACEVEFAPLYRDQPLYWDFCPELAQHKLMSNKFLGTAGQTLGTVVLDNNLVRVLLGYVDWCGFLRHV